MELGESTYNQISIDFNGDEENRFNGIVQHYSNKVENIEDVIKAESSSVYNNLLNYQPKRALLLKKKCIFHTMNEENAFILYDFMEKRIKPTFYSIKSRIDSDSHHLTSWQLRGSNDKRNWDILDEYEDEKSLIGLGNSNTFKINVLSNDNKSYRYLQILQTDVNSSFYYYLTMTSLEFFGTVYELQK